MPSIIVPAPESNPDDSPSYAAEIKAWFTEEASPYCISALVHAAIFLVLGLTLGTIAATRPASNDDDCSSFGPVDIAEKSPDEELIIEPEFTPLSAPPQPEQPAEIDPAKLTSNEESTTTKIDIPDGKDPTEESGHTLGGNEALGSITGDRIDGDPGINVKGIIGSGPKANGLGGNDQGTRKGVDDGSVWGKRGPGNRPTGGGRTQRTDNAVTAALNWIARHQNRDGSWSIEGFNKNCNYGQCSGPGSSRSDSGATALGLLPFLGAGEHHKIKCTYQRNVARGVDWLVRHQKPDGDLSAGTTHVMYSHGLATIALAEAYGMSQDPRLAYAAQAAINFIEKAQNTEDGGWRYKPGDPGDTSVVGWQVMALKSGQMAKLKVNETVLENAKQKWLRGVARGDYQGIFAYQPQREGSLVTMTAVGLLCHEYLGAPKDDPALNEGIEYLLKNLPTNDPGARNIYYWYYATQVIHHVLDARWDQWNRAMRRTLVESQINGDGCDAGSWNPSSDVWGNAGGRLMVTSLSCLTLEVYYRHLPLYDLDKQGPRGKKKPAESAK